MTSLVQQCPILSAQCTTIFDKRAQSPAELLLLPICENGHPPYWNYTFGFDFTY